MVLSGFLLLFLVVLARPAGAQLSPGPLSRAHRSLNGPSGCLQCHEVSTHSPKFKCLDCHREIAAQLQLRRGLHATYSELSAGSGACVKCHSEHNGEDFSLVHWEPQKFDHAKTGFMLEGKHAQAACSSCHNPQHITAAARPEIKSSHSFLGLSRTCTSCHEDKHKGALGPNCLQCHSETEWKPKFDHAKTRYPLTGAHLQVGCQKCHTPGADGAIRYTGLRFDTCAACHKDVHRGAFADKGCDSCHTTSAWRNTAFAAKFDHAKTRFPLLGKHLEVGCLTCHRAGDFKTPIAHDTCATCHADVHNGQFAARADGGKCDSCHTVAGWKPASFALAEHDKTGFPLRGKHAAVACAKCHAPAGKATVFKVKFAQCLDCHQDPHGSQFAAAPVANRCESCHNENGFRPSTFTLARHQKTRFVLAGAHVAVICTDCHKPMVNTTIAQYHFGDLSCAGCHEDPHKGEFNARMQKFGAGGKPLGCEACHVVKTWRDLTRFDHATTSFLLTGAHRAVECSACHRAPNLERTLMHADFKTAPSQCEDCHDDPHGLQFARAAAGGRVTRCAECHTTEKWRPSLFDHEKTAFSLKGPHLNTPCKGCHSNFHEVEGAQVLFYKPTPTKCEVCHGSGVAEKRPS